MRVNTLHRMAITVVGLFAASAPSYAHWGSASAWAFSATNDTKYCTHSSSGHSDYRRVKLHAFRSQIPTDFGPIIFDDADVKNVSPSGRADVFVAGFDYRVPPGSFIGYLGTYNNLAVNGTVRFSTLVGATEFLYNLQASCQTSDNML